MTKKLTIMSLLLMAALLTACDKNKEAEEEESSGAYEIEYFGFQEEEDGPWGLMSTDGTVLVKPKYEGEISVVINDRFFVDDFGEETCVLYSAGSKPKKIGTFQKHGSFTGDYCPVQDMDGNLMYIDKDGNKAFDINLPEGRSLTAVFNFFCGRAMIRLDNGKWGFIDDTGEIVIPCKYADAWNFSDDCAIVYINLREDGDDAKWAVVDTDGKELFTKRFTDLKPSEYNYQGGLLEVTDSDDSYIIIDKKGKRKVELGAENYSTNNHEGVFVVYDHEKEMSGLMNGEGEWLFKPKYNTVKSNGKLVAAKTGDNNYTLYTVDGEKIATLPEGEAVLFDPEFKNYDNVLLVGEWDRGYKLIDAEGNRVEAEAKIWNYSFSNSWGYMSPVEEEYDGDDYEEYQE